MEPGVDRQQIRRQPGDRNEQEHARPRVARRADERADRDEQVDRGGRRRRDRIERRRRQRRKERIHVASIIFK
jgi:hypothetical protein